MVVLSTHISLEVSLKTSRLHNLLCDFKPVLCLPINTFWYTFYCIIAFECLTFFVYCGVVAASSASEEINATSEYYPGKSSIIGAKDVFFSTM